jgi:Na+/H+ antiporter NhaD/arsenite permease-like protein
MMAVWRPRVPSGRDRALVGAIVLYHAAAMNANLRKLILPVVILGIVLIVVAVIYFVEPEHSLPSFFPGHGSVTDPEANHHHTKHGIAALVVALACFAFAWFQTGPKTGSAGSQA